MKIFWGLALAVIWKSAYSKYENHTGPRKQRLVQFRVTFFMRNTGTCDEGPPGGWDGSSWYNVLPESSWRNWNQTAAKKLEKQKIWTELWTLLTHKAATGQVELVPSWCNPDSVGISTDQARLALWVLRQKGHHPLHRRPGYSGNALRGLQQRLEQTSLVKDHVVRNTDLRDTDSKAVDTRPHTMNVKLQLCLYLPPVVIISLRSGQTHAGTKPQAAAGIQGPGRPPITQGHTHEL